MSEQTTSLKRYLEGEVVKISNSNTIKVRVEIKSSHAKYNKVVFSHKQYLAHCADTSAVVVGDKVRIMESRPLSKLKHWVFIEKLSK